MDVTTCQRLQISRNRRVVTSLAHLEKPPICRLNGAAAGLGTTIALLSYIVVVADTARIERRTLELTGE